MSTTNFAPLTAEYLALGGTDFSDHVESAELELDADEVDYTNMGSSGWKENKSGIRSGSLKLTLQQDFSASSIDSTLFTNFSSGSALSFEVRPTNSSVSSTNPKYTGSVRVTKYQPLTGKVGDKVLVSITVPTTGTVSRATA